MDPPAPKPKRSVRKFLRESVSEVFRRSPSPSSSQKPPRAGSKKSRSPSPLPQGQSNPPVAGSSSRVHAATTASTAAIGISTPATSGNEPPAIVVSPAETKESDVPAVQPNQETRRTWIHLGTSIRALHKSTGVLPPLQSAIGSFISCLDVFEEVATNRKEYEELAAELASISELLAKHMGQSTSKRMTGTLANIARAIEEQANLIESKRSRGTASRAIESAADREQLDVCYRQIGSLFRQLQADANLSVWSIVEDQAANNRLKDLDPVQLARYDSRLSTGISRRKCTPHTRTAILSGLVHWSNQFDGADLYWMNGMAGTGKTTIAYSFSELLDERKQLAASFFCTRTSPDCQDVGRIIPTIAYQLARYSVPFQSALCEALAEDPDASSKNIARQFERLLKIPLAKVQKAMPNNLVVIVDALDECSDMREVELLLSILLRSAEGVPLRFFVTSRPEPEIYSRMLMRRPNANDVLHLHDVETSLVQADIQLYLAEELAFMSPTPAEIKELAQRSGNLFIYAATLVRSLVSRKSQTDPRRHLRLMLGTNYEPTAKQHARIDELYASILGAALDENSENRELEEIEDVRRVLRTVICIQEPVSVDVLATLVGLADETQAVDALQPLRAVIHFSERTRLVSTLHVSFPDFMFDQRRSKAFCCDSADQHGVITRRCFEVMKSQLRFNICNLESSFVPDGEIADLEERVKTNISPALSYSCLHWSNHIGPSAYQILLCDLLNEFIVTQLLLWMEVLNLKQVIKLGPGLLLRAKSWLPVETASLDLMRLVEDARNFVTAFANNPISHSTPHIYISLLSFYPRSSFVHQNYWRKTQGVMSPTGTAVQMREHAALVCWRLDPDVSALALSPDGSRVAYSSSRALSIRSVEDGALVVEPFIGHSGYVTAVTFSPDGTYIASGAMDQSIRIWAVHDNSLPPSLLEGHDDAVVSLAYSPCGTRIVSGSWDSTVRVWDVHSGIPALDPFLGHTGPVTSVAFSPSSPHVASGSYDKTIRVWNVQDGTLAASPFEAHTDGVMSIAYSPDGAHIVSGSQDTTIRVWNSRTGTVVAGPFQGHNSRVFSVAYSPNGTRIASVDSEVIRVWSACSGELIYGPLYGHVSSARWVAYLPDGTRIISGSYDGTIRLWDTSDGLLEPSVASLEAHSDSVHCVTYSPDGISIVSGYQNGALRIWEAHNGRLITGPLSGHSSKVTSVAYSPDSTRFVSSSADYTIRVWASLNGALILGPLRGHTSSVESVTYSPDGKSLASCSQDSTVRVWDACSGTPLLVIGPIQGHHMMLMSVAYSPDGARIASGCWDGSIRVWNADDATLVAGPFGGDTGIVMSVAFSPDGTRIVSSTNGTAIGVWSAQTGNAVLGPLHGHIQGIMSVAYSPNGALIASGSWDGAIRLWDAHDGTPLANLSHLQKLNLTSIAFSPDGSFLVSCTGDSAIRVWDVHHYLSSATTPNTYSPSALNDVPSRFTPNRRALFHTWVTNPDGWVTNNELLLFWVPSDIVHHLPTVYNPFVITPFGSLQVDYGDLFLGEDWSNCYEP